MTRTCNLSMRFHNVNILRTPHPDRIVQYLTVKPLASKQLSPAWLRRHASSQTAIKTSEVEHTLADDAVDKGRTPLSQIARQKEANKEFFTNVLSSAATKRDAKAYISRLKSPSKVKTQYGGLGGRRPQVNLGNLFASARSVENSPVFSQHQIEDPRVEEQEILHVALVKLSDLDQVPDQLLDGIAGTLSQLARLGMAPCVVLESTSPFNSQTRCELHAQAERMVASIEAVSDGGARLLENIFTTSLSGQVQLALRKLLLVPLRRGQIPVVLPNSISEQEQTIASISASDAVLALIQEFSEAKSRGTQRSTLDAPKSVSLDRIIVVDQAGGIPSPVHNDGKHVFLNLEQECANVLHYLSETPSATSKQHTDNLGMLRQALQILPSTASGLMVTPQEVANLDQVERDSDPSWVGTRRQKNALIHNLLTDKPAYSSSLPRSRLSKKPGTTSPPPVATFVKHGMPLTILPDPAKRPWMADSPRIKLTDSRIDLSRLVHLIDDSFNRELDVEHYLRRVNDRLAGVIIAGDYEGGAILTWETPPGVDTQDSSRLVPYLDKFAVLKRSQGAGGVADIVFNAMVRTCFPNGVCWRSRKNNPVNKWYFERSRGTRKIPDMNWTMFWTTPGVADNAQKFQDYEGVCRGVEPSWANKKLAAD